MVQLWISPSVLYPLLVLLCGTTAQESTNPPGAVPPQLQAEPSNTVNPPSASSINGSTPKNDSLLETQTRPLVRVAFPVIPTTVPHNTTMDMLSIMSERDRLQKESERLRTAVIVLGVFFVLAAAAVIAGAAWYFMKRRKSTKLGTGNHAQKTTSAELKRETLPQKTHKKDSSDTENTHQKTETADQQGKELRKSPSTSASNTSGDYEDQSNLPDSSQRKSGIVAPKTNKVVYVNTGANQTQPGDAAALDPQEVYVELDKGSIRSSAEAKTLPQSRDAEQQTPKDDVYENVTPDALKNYSALDTESQYEHHYDKM